MPPKFEPKTPVNLDPPKDDPITLEDLAQADGEFYHKIRLHLCDILTFSQKPLTSNPCRLSEAITNTLRSGTEGKKAYVAIKVSLTIFRSPALIKGPGHRIRCTIRVFHV